MQDQARGKNVAIGGAVLQLIFAAVTLGAWLLSGSQAALAAGLFVLAGVGLWLLVAVQFYCRQLAAQEAAELEELARTGEDRGRLFEGDERAARPAGRRQEVLDRWVVPIFTVLWAGLHATIGVLMLRYLWGREAAELTWQPQGGLFIILAGFLSFLFSRYCTGMSRGPAWRALRATGSYLLISTAAGALAAAGLLASWQGYGGPDRVAGILIEIAALVLAVELLLNVVLDLYRPRVPGEEARASFDSRLFGLVAEPARVGHSIAETLNYQFGFEVSRTWFYRLVSRAIVPLLLFAVALLFALSSVVVVEAGEQFVVFRLGRVHTQRGPLGPGVHLKLPWPIDTTERFDVGAVREMWLGTGRERTREEREAEFVKGREIYRWDQEHGARVERDFLIAVDPEEFRRGQERLKKEREGERPPPPVHIIKLVAVLYYQIDDVMKWGFRYADAPALLHDVAYEQMTEYYARMTLTEDAADRNAEAAAADGVPERPRAIMTTGRQQAAAALRTRIAGKVGPKGLDLGVRIRAVKLVTVHPPMQAAEAYYDVAVAERERDRLRNEARAEANQKLALSAGTPYRALRLAEAISRLYELTDLQDLRDQPERFGAQLGEYVRAARKDLARVGEEIERERQLGRVQEGEATTAMRLRPIYAEHVAALEELARQVEREGPPDLSARIGRAHQRAEALLGSVRGEAAEVLASARSVSLRHELEERGRLAMFRQELPAFLANDRLYRLDRVLGVLSEKLPGIWKYVLLGEPEQLELWLDWEKSASRLSGLPGEALQDSQGE